MKKMVLGLVLFLVFLLPSNVIFAGDDSIEINEKNFPDKNFRLAISDQYDKDGDGKANIDDITTLTVEGASSLKGIEKLTNLKSININTEFNSYTEINLSGCKNLDQVEIMPSSKTITLDLSSSKEIKYMSIYNSFVKWSDGKTYYQNSFVKYDNIEAGSFSNLTWEKGISSEKFNGVVYGIINGKKAYWAIKDSIVTGAFSGIYKNKYYILNGTFMDKADGLVKITSEGKTDWWYLKNGIIQNVNGFVENSYGWWYVECGRVDFNKNDVIKGTVNNKNGWWYVKNGKVNFEDSVRKNSNGWFSIKNGMVDFTLNGFATNENGLWYCKNGRVDFNKTGLVKGKYGNDTVWYYVKNGKVQEGFTGIQKNSYGWWYCRNGKVDFSYNGIAENYYGKWYCHGGCIDFKYTGDIKIDGQKYKVKNGRIIK